MTKLTCYRITVFCERKQTSEKAGKLSTKSEPCLQLHFIVLKTVSQFCKFHYKCEMRIMCYCTRTVTFTVCINLFQNKMLK